MNLTLILNVQHTDIARKSKRRKTPVDHYAVGDDLSIQEGADLQKAIRNSGIF